MNRVMDELPAYYRDIKEFQELTRVQSKQLDSLDGAIQQFEDDQFILTSSEPAIYRREKEFNILPDRTTETLDFRKRRLLGRMMQKAPFTFRYMVQQLDELVGKNQYIISIDVTNYWLEVLVTVESQSYYKEAAELLERTVPLNLILETGILVDQTKVVLRAKEYTFPVPYPITGTFHTAAVNGVASKATLATKASEYTFQVPYPTTGAFYCTNER
ncbi:putative phage tail protein [Sporosarcina sp. FSL K6-5500]|uniref:putative phage tail protein n=1 Tax=Sporosarcina sp. FSL K6-5500 TaxID=2921558 RepID=UPI0030FB1759